MPTLPILLAALGAGAALQTPPEPPLARASVQIVASLRDDIGRQIATAATSFGKDFTASITTGASGCELRSGGAGPADALIVWTVEGRLTRNTPTEVSLRLTWRRGGTMAPLPNKEQDLTIHPGDRLPLDRVALAPTGSCRATSVSLHIAALSRIEQVEDLAQATSRARADAIAAGGGERSSTTAGARGRVGASGVGAGGGGGQGGAGTGGGGARGVGGGTGGGFGQGAGGGARAGGSATGSAVGTAPPVTNPTAPPWGGRGGGWFGADVPGGNAAFERTRTLLRDTGFESSSLREVTVEFWLVDQYDDGTGQSYATTVKTVPGRGEFKFDPVAISGEAPTTPKWVIVEGVVQAQKQPDGGDLLYLGVLKAVALDQAGTWWSDFHSHKSTMPMPAPGEVLEFVLPRQRPEGSATMGRWPLSTPGHTFSLRLRVMR